MIWTHKKSKIQEMDRRNQNMELSKRIFPLSTLEK